MRSSFYVTTPIYYVNDNPHIGHAYTTILADVLARYHRGQGEEVFFLTGLDEHGQKVQQAAQKRGVPEQQHCDELAPRFSNLWKKLEIRNDDFIRTTELRHVKAVQAALQKVYDAGDVYVDEYEGWYSVAEERFITDTEKESGHFRDVKRLKERNYFFKMSKYQQRLIDHINTHPEFIQPEHRKNEILGFLRQPLGDLCISRPKLRMGWGIEIPFVAGTAGGSLVPWSSKYREHERVKGEYSDVDHHGYILVTVEEVKVTIAWKALLKDEGAEAWRILDSFSYTLPPTHN